MPDFYTITTYLEYNPEIIWIVVAAVFFIFEVSTPGIGFLFSALGALSLGGFMSIDIIEPENFYTQFAYFLGFTSLWALLLWKPMKHFMNKSADSYEEFIGMQATVVDKPLEKGRSGKIKWSGTIITAMLLKDSAESSIPIDTEVWIHGKEGMIFIVDTVQPYSESGNT